MCEKKKNCKTETFKRADLGNISQSGPKPGKDYWISKFLFFFSTYSNK